MAGLARFVLRHRLAVAVAWVLVLLCGGALSQKTISRLTFDFSLPHQPGFETSQRLLHEAGFDPGQGGPVLPVISVAPGRTVAQDAAAIGRAFESLRSDPKGYRVADLASTHDQRFVTRDGRSTFAMVFTPPFNPTTQHVTYDTLVQQRLTPLLPPGAMLHVTGRDKLQTGGSTKGPGVLAETMLGGIGALAVLAFVFASFMALVPIVVAIFSILATFLALLGVTYLTPVSFIAQFLVAVIGLGVAIDYSLLIVTRWREEKDKGRSNDEAVVESLRTAGHAVVFSAGTVAVGLFALVVIPVPFLRSIGFAGMLIPLISMSVVLTLLPAILSKLGPFVDRPRIRHEDTASRAWTRWAQLIVRRRWLAAGLAMAFLIALLLPLSSMSVGLPKAAALAHGGEASDSLHALVNGGVPEGVLTPIVALNEATPGAAVAQAAARVPGVAAAYQLPLGDRASSSRSVTVVLPEQETVAGGSVGVVRQVRTALRATPGFVGVAGMGAVQIDYVNGVYKHFPETLAVIVVLTFLLLARAFRSVLLPLKAVVLNLISLGATFGAVVWFWQQGHGSQSLFSIAPTGAITFWLPVMIFAFLFGLSMDYEVFILSRMREEYDATGSTSTAVITGIGRTGRLVTSAALILFLTFVSLASSPQTDLKVFATALGAGILLDATVVRALLVPALVSLFGAANWWMPRWLERALLVRRS